MLSAVSKKTAYRTKLIDEQKVGEKIRSEDFLNTTMSQRAVAKPWRHIPVT